MAPMKKRHVLAALLLLIAVTAIGHDVEGAIIPGNVDAVNAFIFGVVPCSTGRMINEATAPPFPNADLQLLCGTTVWANATAGINGDFTVALGNIRNGSGGVGILLPSLLANQCRVAVTTPLAVCDVSLAGASGMLSAPVQFEGRVNVFMSAAAPFSFA